METMRMYFKLLGMAVKSMTQFRANFLVGVFGVIFYHTINLLAIGVILNRFQNLAGWTVWEIVFLYGIWNAGNSIYSMLFLHIQDLEFYIVEGQFDRFLLRPLSPFLQLLGEEVDFNGAADLLSGGLFIGIAMSRLGLEFGPVQWVFLLMSLVAGALVSTGITWVLSSAAFWTTRSRALVSTAMQVNWQMTQQYPLEMFGRGFRVLVTCFIPTAFLNYYPARWLLGKTHPGDPWYFLSFMGPVAAAILLAIGAFVWKKGLRAYNSTGS